MSPECSAVGTLGQNDNAEVGQSDSIFAVTLWNAAPWATSASQKRHLVDTRDQEAATWSRPDRSSGYISYVDFFAFGLFSNCTNFKYERCKYIR